MQWTPGRTRRTPARTSRCPVFGAVDKRSANRLRGEKVVDGLNGDIETDTAYHRHMANRTLGLSDELVAYLQRYGVREHPALARLRERTAPMEMASMQIGPDQGAFMALLVQLTGARRVLEIGTFTGYSSTVMALALPPDGRMVCCDVSREWTDVAREAWADAGVADRIDLRLAPATQTLGTLDDASFDLAFIDADKESYDAYYEGCLRVVRPGGLIMIDNTLWSGRVADPLQDDAQVSAIRALNEQIAADERVDHVVLAIGDGLTLARIRAPGD
jgi:predicted O-methyltransferase YrrM